LRGRKKHYHCQFDTECANMRLNQNRNADENPR